MGTGPRNPMQAILQTNSGFVLLGTEAGVARARVQKLSPLEGTGFSWY
jgi:hypothetical protein